MVAQFRTTTPQVSNVQARIIRSIATQIPEAEKLLDTYGEHYFWSLLRRSFVNEERQRFSNPNLVIGDRIRQAYEAKGMQQIDLHYALQEARVAIGQEPHRSDRGTALCRYVKGHRTIDYMTGVLISQILDVSPDAFFPNPPMKYEGGHWGDRPEMERMTEEEHSDHRYRVADMVIYLHRMIFAVDGWSMGALYSQMKGVLTEAGAIAMISPTSFTESGLRHARLDYPAGIALAMVLEVPPDSFFPFGDRKYIGGAWREQV